MTIELTFDGAAVTAHIEGTGGLTPFTLSGLMQGGRCHLRSDSGLEVWEGPCGPDGFSGTVRSTPQNRLNVKGEFQTATTSLVDIEEENRKAAEEKRFADAKSTEEARLNAERQRVAIAKMKASLPKGAETRYEPLLEAAVMEDSKHWFLNRYQPGSVDLLAVKHDKSGAIFLKASFSYAGGSPSWVGAIILKNQLQCLTFPDDPQGCRPIGEGAGGKFGSALMADALAGPGDVDASGCGATCRDYQSWQANKDIYDTYHPN